MNTNTSVRFVFISVLALFFGGCAMMEQHKHPLAGNWKNDLGTVWMIHADGTFDVDLNKDGKRDAWGTYTVSGDKVTLMAIGGMHPKGCTGKGVYHFKRDGNTLRFAVVSDACKLRKKNVLMTWHATK
jgi:hypothetical protein